MASERDERETYEGGRKMKVVQAETTIDNKHSREQSEERESEF
jgi:hypothetical protein